MSQYINVFSISVEGVEVLVSHQPIQTRNRLRSQKIFSNLCGRSLSRYIDVSDTFLTSLPYQYRLVFRILEKRSHHETFELLPNLLRANVLYRHQSCILFIFPKIVGRLFVFTFHLKMVFVFGPLYLKKCAHRGIIKGIVFYLYQAFFSFFFCLMVFCPIDLCSKDPISGTFDVNEIVKFLKNINVIQLF